MGQVRKLWIEGPAGRLEAALRVARHARSAAVIAHPHPLHGGTLHNPVVFHADRELNRAGFTTMRFHFRGVGQSDGLHDEGRGEVEDVAAVVSWLRGIATDLPLVLVGYSFGSLCVLRHASREGGVAGVVAIGLPSRVYGLEELRRLRVPLAIVQGSEDEFGPPEEIRALLRRTDAPARLHVVDGSSHLFPGRAPEAAARIVAAAEALLEEKA